ncbi:MAG: alpha/beta fold hydrolase [Alphaproteobacteria bacterium]|nr:alpha/beta fold hydrolase [Alphaproteobacteria bacterium]
MPTLDRNGVRIHYDVAGHGPVILLTHGFSATGEMWQGQVAALKDRFTVVTWDMRGHGRSDYPADQGAYSEQATVADMAALLDTVGAERAVIGGLSLGGYMSLAFHRAHPERTRALLIIDTGPGYRNDQARQGWNANAIQRAERYESEGLPDLSRGSAEVRAARHRDATGLARAARGMLTQRDARVIESLPHIGVPAIVIVGENDTPFLAASEYMAAKIPGAKKAVIPNAGHAANIDNPAAFNAALTSFLDAARLFEPA